MNRHQTTRDGLYDYAMGDLPSDEQLPIEEHLADCGSCRRDLARMREALHLLPRPTNNPSADQSQAYWEMLPLQIERSIQSRSGSGWRGRYVHLRDMLLSFAVMRKGQLTLAGFATAMCAIAIILLMRPQPESTSQRAAATTEPSIARQLPESATDDSMAPVHNPPPSQARSAPASTRVTADRVSDYLRRSKILFIGVANIKDDSDAMPDLSTERTVSRALVKEARYLKKEPNLNPRAKELIDELNRVLIQLANLGEQNDASGIEIVRGGIRQENLLFKIRMAENAMDVTHSTPNSTKKEGSPL